MPNFKKTLVEFQHEVQENTRELTKDVERAQELEKDIPLLKAKLHAEEGELNHLKPQIMKLQREKSELHRGLQQIEQENRHDLNAHITDKSKMIKPLHP